MADEAFYHDTMNMSFQSILWTFKNICLFISFSHRFIFKFSLVVGFELNRCLMSPVNIIQVLSWQIHTIVGGKPSRPGQPTNYQIDHSGNMKSRHDIINLQMIIYLAYCSCAWPSHPRAGWIEGAEQDVGSDDIEVLVGNVRLCSRRGTCFQTRLETVF